MSVTATNLILGAGTLFTGAFGAVEPLDASINSAPAASAWTDVGGTQGGVKFSVDQKFAVLNCDQLVDDVGSRLTQRAVMFETTLAEPTLANLSLAINGGVSATGANYASIDPITTTAAAQVPYFAAIMDGPGVGPVNSVFRRRILIRKAINNAKVESAYTQDKQTYIPVTFKSHYVSAAVTPWRFTDQTA